MYVAIVGIVFNMATSTPRRYKLTYYPLRARAEPIRIILTLVGADWEDYRNMTDDDLAALNQRKLNAYLVIDQP